MSRASVTVRYVGDDEFRRYYIVRPLDEKFWTGSDWTPQRRGALLYANLVEAHEEYQRLAVRPYLDKPLREFRAELYVQVRTDQPYSLPELVAYLNRAFRGIVDTDACGDGPVPECLVLLRASFMELKELDQPGNGDGSAQ